MAGIPWPGEALETPGTLQIERDMLPFHFDGIPLTDCFMESRDSALKEALTVTSHNALVAGKYPRSGKKMWSRFGLRTPDRRYVWDGLYRMREVADLTERPPEGLSSRLKDRWVETPKVWSRLAEQRAQAIGPGPKLGRELFPRFTEEPEEEDAPLEEAMRMLGYAE